MTADAASSREQALHRRNPSRQVLDAILTTQRRRSRSPLVGPVQLTLLGIGCIIGDRHLRHDRQRAARSAGPGDDALLHRRRLRLRVRGPLLRGAGLDGAGGGLGLHLSLRGDGRVVAWLVGWALILEYGVAAATVAVGWSGNVVGLLANFGHAHTATTLTTSFIKVASAAPGRLACRRRRVQRAGAASASWVTALLVLGINEVGHGEHRDRVHQGGRADCCSSASASAIINIDNWKPFIPANEGGFGTYGVHRRLPGGLGDLLRLRGLRRGLHGRGGDQEPADGHADRASSDRSWSAPSSTCWSPRADRRRARSGRTGRRRARSRWPPTSDGAHTPLVCSKEALPIKIGAVAGLHLGMLIL